MSEINNSVSVGIMFPKLLLLECRLSPTKLISFQTVCGTVLSTEMPLQDFNCILLMSIVFYRINI